MRTNVSHCGWALEVVVLCTWITIGVLYSHRFRCRGRSRLPVVWLWLVINRIRFRPMRPRICFIFCGCIVIIILHAIQRLEFAWLPWVDNGCNWLFEVMRWCLLFKNRIVDILHRSVGLETFGAVTGSAAKYRKGLFIFETIFRCRIVTANSCQLTIDAAGPRLATGVWRWNPVSLRLRWTVFSRRRTSCRLAVQGRVRVSSNKKKKIMWYACIYVWAQELHVVTWVTWFTCTTFWGRFHCFRKTMVMVFKLKFYLDRRAVAGRSDKIFRVVNVSRRREACRQSSDLQPEIDRGLSIESAS